MNEIKLAEANTCIITNIPNRSSHEDVEVLSRLILQKIISSDASKYMSKTSYLDLQKAFLAPVMPKEIMLSFGIDAGNCAKDNFFKHVSFVRVAVGQ